MGFTIKEKDTGWKAFAKTLLKIDDKEVVVGIPGEPDFEAPNNAALGLWHEFGTEGFEDRSFIRSTFDANQNKYQRALEKYIKSSLFSKLRTDNRALFVLGERARADVINRIRRREIRQELAESTLRQKDGTTALIESAGLIGSIVSKVRNAT